MSKIMKTLNGYEVVDEKARQDIEELQNKQVEVDLSNYYNKAETAALVDKAIDNIEIPTVDLEPYATKQFVADEIAKIDIPEGGDVDLDGYATEVWVNNQGFIKEHQSLDGYATEKYVDDAISNIDIPEGGDVDLSDYYKKNEVDNLILTGQSQIDLANQSAIQSINQAGYQTAANVQLLINAAISRIPATDLSNYYTKAQVDTLIAEANMRSDNYYTAVVTDYYTKEQVDAKFANIATAEGGSY